jgi:hypothetical protein
MEGAERGLSGFAVRFSRCRMGGEVVGDPVPGEFVADPDMVGRRQFVGGVQAACHHVDGVRSIGSAVGERGAALAAEASRHVGGGMEFGGPAFRDREAVGGEDHERECRRGGRSAAGLAVAYAARLRFSFDAVSNRSAQASTFSHAAPIGRFGKRRAAGYAGLRDRRYLRSRNESSPAQSVSDHGTKV